MAPEEAVALWKKRFQLAKMRMGAIKRRDQKNVRRHDSNISLNKPTPAPVPRDRTKVKKRTSQTSTRTSQTSTAGMTRAKTPSSNHRSGPKEKPVTQEAGRSKNPTQMPKRVSTAKGPRKDPDKPTKISSSKPRPEAKAERAQPQENSRENKPRTPKPRVNKSPQTRTRTTQEDPINVTKSRSLPKAAGFGFKPNINKSKKQTSEHTSEPKPQNSANIKPSKLSARNEMNKRKAPVKTYKIPRRKAPVGNLHGHGFTQRFRKKGVASTEEKGRDFTSKPKNFKTRNRQKAPTFSERERKPLKEFFQEFETTASSQEAGASKPPNPHKSTRKPSPAPAPGMKSDTPLKVNKKQKPKPKQTFAHNSEKAGERCQPTPVRKKSSIQTVWENLSDKKVHQKWSRYSSSRKPRISSQLKVHLKPPVARNSRLTTEEQKKRKITDEVNNWARNKSIFTLLSEINGTRPVVSQDRTMSFNSVSKGYKKTLLKIHPDKHMKSSACDQHRSNELLKVINEAYERYKALHEL